MTSQFAFGGRGDAGTGLMGMGVPLLGGEAREPVEEAVSPAGDAGGFCIWRGAARAVGIARAEPGTDLEDATARLYAGLLVAARGLDLYRIWNLVPGINARTPAGLETYQAFCKARSVAFESALGRDFQRSLPAASAVGTAESGLTVAFLAGKGPVRRVENPAQVPAYEYPPQHGPRPPSFARATVVESGQGVDAFVSGTSSVVGHETVAPCDTARQLDCTFENLRLISGACGLGGSFGGGAACRRHFKVYLRNASDLDLAAREMGRRILAPGDRVTYLRADICRSALNVEIEVTVRGSARA
jgi:hypothetical protein